MLAAANVFFFVFHTALILFNVFGWLVRKLRVWNCLTLWLTFVSWCVMGIWKGVGYCVCTDIHWHIRRAMGIEDHANSYLVLLVQKLSGWDPPVWLVNDVAGVVFAFCLIASTVLTIGDYVRVRQIRAREKGGATGG